MKTLISIGIACYLGLLAYGIQPKETATAPKIIYLDNGFIAYSDSHEYSYNWEEKTVKIAPIMDSAETVIKFNVAEFKCDQTTVLVYGDGGALRIDSSGVKEL